MISNDFVMKVNSKTLLIIKRIISLNVDINEDKKIIILLLSVSNDRSIINFELNAFKAIFNEIFLKIKMKLNKLIIFSSTIAYFF